MRRDKSKRNEKDNKISANKEGREGEWDDVEEKKREGEKGELQLGEEAEYNRK